MRILQLAELYPPFIGGSERHVFNLAHGLTRRGHSVTVATVASGNQPSVSDEDGVRVHRLGSTTARASRFVPSGRPYLPPLPDPEIVRGLRRIIRRHRPDVVHAHNWMVHSFLPLKGQSRARLLLTLHDFSLVCAKRTLLYGDSTCSGPGPLKCLVCAGAAYGALRGPAVTLSGWVMKPALERSVDTFVPVSEAVAQHSRLVGSRLPYEVVPNFVPDDLADSADPDHPALRDLPQEPFWLFVGTLSRHKGVHFLVEAYREVPGAPPLVLVGRPADDLPDLPSGVTVVPDLPHGAVIAAWQRASLGFVPSLLPDACPTVAIEAMACGVPVIATRMGGLPELVADGETGLVVEPGDVAGLREAMCRLLGNPGVVATMAQRSRERAQGYSASRAIARLESLYADGAQ